MDWDRDGTDWPNREASRLVTAGPHRWHVQIAGEGPTLLLLHGTGGATHSWRDLLPILARTHRVVAPDLPGHAFTRLGTRRRSSLPAMTEDLWTLCDALGERPTAILGHSAGAAIAVAMAADRPEVETVVGLNAALGTFSGPAGWIFPLLARGIALTPFVPIAFSQISALTGGAGRLLSSTGSRIDARGEALYSRLLSHPSHVEGAVQMMAQWSVDRAVDALPTLPARCIFLSATQDRTVPADLSETAARRARDGRHVSLGPLGHLAHEERPKEVAALIEDALAAPA